MTVWILTGLSDGPLAFESRAGGIAYARSLHSGAFPHGAPPARVAPARDPGLGLVIEAVSVIADVCGKEFSFGGHSVTTCHLSPGHDEDYHEGPVIQDDDSEYLVTWTAS